MLFNFWGISAYFRRSWFCSRRLSVFELGTKIQSNFCSKLVHCVMIDKKKTPKEREENDDQRIH
ncbi:hypothetical protein FKY78_04660 [Enterococcus faecalis]|uniref:hypothetical protein n=1 Tax=Enterococcus TaxID=1350 RepID=UPI0009E5DF25|nr:MULTISPECIES: hypothetical protein [Enterococcus]EGO9396779.1 hypothetical protein [Enterococcus faecalis]MDN3198660.1 hypothetical protein [Enterococcus faecalis]MDT2087060.1 hypothetical protein [Enterococcus faecalis]NFA94465.1 hypothetical protein [Enterococcus faecalis]PQE87775.1 hypothetical protein CUS08_05790 [Enterococcus faecalis]